MGCEISKTKPGDYIITRDREIWKIKNVITHCCGPDSFEAAEYDWKNNCINPFHRRLFHWFDIAGITKKLPKPPDNQRVGIDWDFLQELQDTRFALQSTKCKRPKKGFNCSICLSGSRRACIQFPCTHSMHYKCFVDCLINHKRGIEAGVRCPICRANVSYPQ